MDRQPTARLTFRELGATRADLHELERFYRDLYVPEFPDPDERESLANLAGCLKRGARLGAHAFHIVLAEWDGRTVGGSVADYLGRPNAGMVEFLFVTRSHQAHGVGGPLLAETERLLRADAREHRGRPLRALLAEMTDADAPSEHGGMDPRRRAHLFGRWGFGKLDFDYVQPALSREQAPVTHLVLIARFLGRQALRSAAAPWVLEVVSEYMRWAMRIRRPERNPEFQRMAAQLRRCRRIPWVPLGAPPTAPSPRSCDSVPSFADAPRGQSE